MIAYCGINCSECPAYIATQKNDNEARKKVAEEWQKAFNPNIKPEDINCDGCTSNSARLFNYCKECKIRLCGIEKKVENCAYCNEYTCEKLAKFFEMAPKVKETLDNIRKDK
jgi:hypothetical protein